MADEILSEVAVLRYARSRCVHMCCVGGGIRPLAESHEALRRAFLKEREERQQYQSGWVTEGEENDALRAANAALTERVRVLEEALKTTLHALHEQEAWEADFITQPEAWRTLDGLPVVPQDILGRWIAWGYVRRGAMKTARAALQSPAAPQDVDAEVPAVDGLTYPGLNRGERVSAPPSRGERPQTYTPDPAMVTGILGSWRNDDAPLSREEEEGRSDG